MEKNAGFQKENMSVLNHVDSLDHWAYSHIKMDSTSTLRVFGLLALIGSQTTYRSRERITEFTCKNKKESHPILFSFLFLTF